MRDLPLYSLTQVQKDGMPLLDRNKKGWSGMCRQMRDSFFAHDPNYGIIILSI